MKYYNIYPCMALYWWFIWLALKLWVKTDIFMGTCVIVPRWNICHLCQRKQIFIVRIVKFYPRSTGVNFHTFAIVRGNVQFFHGKTIISNSKIPSFHEGFEVGSEPFTFITNYCWYGEVLLFLAYCISDIKNYLKILLK